MSNQTLSDAKTVRDVLLEIAKEKIKAGPGFAQEPVVLREAITRLSAQDLESQQAVLTSWHDLFRQGDLAWGYNFDNPGRPFFHLAQR